MMMNDLALMMWGMGLLWLLVLVVLVLGAAALLKYLFSGGRRDRSSNAEPNGRP